MRLVTQGRLTGEAGRWFPIVNGPVNASVVAIGAVFEAARARPLSVQGGS